MNTNRRLDGGGDKSPLGYSLRVAEEEKELYQVYRQMNASSLRFIRLFVNCCFLGHVIVEGVSTFRSICDSSVVGARVEEKNSVIALLSFLALSLVRD